MLKTKSERVLNLKPIMKAFTTILPCLAGMGLLVAAFSAQAISYNITSDHSSGIGGLGTAPFGTVTLNQSGTSVDVSVHLNTGYEFVLTGSADFMDFKFNASGVALADISITQNAPYTLTAKTGLFNGDGTGDFGFGITGNLQGNGASGGFSTDIMFSVANATITDLTQPNNVDTLFVADLYSTVTGNTGPADVSVPSVPDGGSTLTLVGAALVGLGGWRRIVKK